MKGNILKTSFLLAGLSVLLSGCSFTQDFGGLKWLDEKASAFFKSINDDQKKSVMEFMQENKGKTDTAEEKKTLSANDLSAKDKEMIDLWLEKKGFNRYGDDKSAIYSGGTPLFDEETGEYIDRYDYILNKFPDILTRMKE